tara:strand:- start:63 stop:188 length:126 start_codon:yes stop_codon:yes gene_type:complete
MRIIFRKREREKREREKKERDILYERENIENILTFNKSAIT